MQVKAVVYEAEQFSEDLYQRALAIVDDESAARIQRFYRRDDACRTLIGRLLVRTVLAERGISPSGLTFGITAAKKPYIASPTIDPPIGFNITHDNAIVAVAICEGVHHPPAYSIGMDIMKVQIPRRESFASFVQTVSDQLTPLEYRLIFNSVTQDEGLRRFFWMWTMKEAYTKALGIGLGFDFKRVEYNVPEEVITVDGDVPRGWEFRKFEIMNGDDLYQGVVAQYLGSQQLTIVLPVQTDNDWLVQYDAAALAEQVLSR